MKASPETLTPFLLAIVLLALPAACVSPIRPTGARDTPLQHASPALAAGPPPPSGLEVPPESFRNPWSEPTRDVLVQYCGKCHRSDLPAAPRPALAVFDLLDDPWYGRLRLEQLDRLLERVRGMGGAEAVDVETVTRFVQCARDGSCVGTGGK